MKKVNAFFLLLRYLLRWTILVLPVSLVAGSLVALFLWLLDEVTRYRWAHGWLLFLLPVAGVAIHLLYKLWGKNAEGGNNLIINEIHEPGGGVPARMAPLVIITTLITHLFGGSAGREGTAVQVGGSMAALFAKIIKLKEEDTKIMLMAGVAAGFGAVFGTPVTGAIFAIEVLAIGQMRYQSLLPCLFATLLADVVTDAWGIHHTQYQVLFKDNTLQVWHYLHFNFLLFIKVVLSSILFGLASFAFARTTHFIKQSSGKYISADWLRPVAGAAVIIVLTFLLGTTDYLGLGVTSNNPGGVSIVNAFKPGGVQSFSFLWKLLFTAVTLGTGFKGGEVTPLFFIGAALGNTLAAISGAPVDLLAALGFIAVFAGATNTPVACTLMGVELFGGEHLIYYAVACFTAYYFSGSSGIYSAQRIAVHKYPR